MSNKIKPTFYFLHHVIKIRLLSIFLIGFITYLIFEKCYNQLIVPVVNFVVPSLRFLVDADKHPDLRVALIAIILIIIYPIGIWFLCLLIKKLFYKCVTFSFNDTGITYTINFVIFSQKHVRYSDIKEINLNQGPLQRLFGLATIKITTHATTADAGIELYNIKAYHEVYDFLMKKTNTK